MIMDGRARDLALDAINDAFKSHVGKLFDVMALDIASAQDGAAAGNPTKERFCKGLFIACGARVDAVDAINKIHQNQK